MTSIRVRLLKWLVGPILAVNLAVGLLAYLLSWTPARIAFDQSLADTASALAAGLHASGAGVHLDLPPQAEQMLRADPADTLYFAVRDARGRVLAGDATLPVPAGVAGQLVTDAEVAGEAVRMVLLPQQAGGQQVVVAVAKTMRKLHGTRSAMVRVLVLIEALFALGLVGLIWFSVTNGLAPLNRMRAALDARTGDDLAPLGTAVPFELQPMVGALNGLLARLRSGARAQQDFLADMAHQLRTPLAGLRTQLEWLHTRRAGDPEEARSIDMMRLSAERMTRHVNQLLSLARAEPSQFGQQRLEPVDLAVLVGDAVQGFVEQAGARQIDLGFSLERTVVAGDSFLLRDLVDNLVDNALRYTPPGGTVNVACRVEDGQGVLRIDDTGPGIEPARREAVFQRFVRLDDKTTGSGLGLAIVRDIAHAHRASITLDDNPAGRGLVFTIRFPLAPR